jgi:frataxin
MHDAHDAKEDFMQAAQAMLAHCADTLENLGSEALEVDFLHDVLEIAVTGAAGGVYVLHPHRVTQQIWLASPQTGAHHYYYEAPSRRWISTQSGPDLPQQLENELGPVVGHPIDLTIDLGSAHAS